MGTPDSSSNRATLQEWLDALESAGAQPKPQGRGFMARCPAHNDSNPSLHVSPGDSVPVIAKCFAGCQFKDIIAALDLGQLQWPTGTGPPAIQAQAAGGEETPTATLWRNRHALLLRVNRRRNNPSGGQARHPDRENV